MKNALSGVHLNLLILAVSWEVGGEEDRRPLQLTELKGNITYQNSRLPVMLLQIHK
jgi:hypothetical protein